jgi:hypothetical protein
MTIPEGAFLKDIILGDCEFSDDLTPRFGTPELHITFWIGRDLLGTIGLPQLIGLTALAGTIE